MSSNLTRPFEIVTPMIIVAGLTGNVIVFCLIIKNKKMRTPFNYLLLNLAVSDLLCTIFGGLFFAGQIRNRYFSDGNLMRNKLERTVCKIGTTSFGFTTNNSVLTLAAISTDRFYAIVHPWRYKRAITKRKIYVVLVAIWFVATITAVPMALIISQTPNKIQDGNSVALCLQHLMEERRFKPVAIVDLIVTYIIPMVIILRTSFAIIKHLWCESSCKTGFTKPDWGQSLLKSRKRITRVTFSVIIAFNIFWLPWAILEGSFLMGAVLQIDDKLFAVMFTLVLASASVNPILYSFQSRQFRKAVKRMLC